MQSRPYLLRSLIAGVAVAWALPAFAESDAPGLRHVAIERAAPNQPLAFAASTTNCANCSLVLYTRTRGRSFFGRMPMKRTPKGHRAVLGANETAGEHLHYYLEVRDDSGGVVARSGRAHSPHVVMLDPRLKPAPPPPAPRRVVRRTPAPAPSKARTATRCDIGTQASYIHYEEPGLMKESGMMMGVTGRCKAGTRTYAALETRLSFGWVDYDGKLMTGEPYTVSNNFNTLFELRGIVGKRLVSGQRANLSGYVGAGYRRLFDGLGQDPAGYDRTSQYVYSPIGLRLATRVQNTTIRAHAEYRHFWTGRQRSDLSDLSPMLPDVTNKQRRGYGWNLGSGISTTAAWGGRVEFQPYVSYWSIEDSDPVQLGTDANGQPVGLHEPKNNSTEVGFNLAVEF